MVALFHPRVLEPGFDASITPETEIDCFCRATSRFHNTGNGNRLFLTPNFPGTRSDGTSTAPEMELVALQALLLLQAPTFGSVFCKPKRDPCQ